VVLAFRTDAERLVDDLAEEHAGARGAAHPEAFGDPFGFPFERIFSGELGHRDSRFRK
jgi:hypothetical protein